MPVERISGDLFLSKASVIACPVNTIGVMGAGLARAFRDKYPDLYYQYKRQCRIRNFSEKSLMVFSPTGAPHRVLMVPTKKHWKDPSPPELVKNSLRNIAKLGEEGKLISLALPALGCGKGELDFEEVATWVDEILGPSPIHVELYEPRQRGA